MITGYNKTGDFFALLRACLLVGYVEFARNIRQKWKGYFVACEQALCLGKKIARKGKFPARPKACSQARYFVSREALVARQFWKVLSPPTLPRPISIPLSSFVSSRLQPRRHGSIDPIFRKVEERQAQSMPRWTGMNSSVTYAHGRRICPLDFLFLRLKTIISNDQMGRLDAYVVDEFNVSENGDYYLFHLSSAGRVNYMHTAPDDFKLSLVLSWLFLLI